jgi:hypothetical protein
MVLDDDYLHPFEQLFTGLVEFEPAVGDLDVGAAMRVTGVKVDVPIELTIGVTDRGTVAMASSPPTQHVATTYMPVFHRIRLSIQADDEESDADG